MRGDESPLDQTTLTACGAVFGLTAAEMADIIELPSDYKPGLCMYGSNADHRFRKDGLRYCGGDAEMELFGITMCLNHWNGHIDMIQRCEDMYRHHTVLTTAVDAVTKSLRSDDESDRILGKFYLKKLARSGIDVHATAALGLLAGEER